MLFENNNTQPLADKLRLNDFNETTGQDHLFGKNGIITRIISSDKSCKC